MARGEIGRRALQLHRLLDTGTLPNVITEATNHDNADQVSLLSQPHWPSGCLRRVSELLPKKIPTRLQVPAGASFSCRGPSIPRHAIAVVPLAVDTPAPPFWQTWWPGDIPNLSFVQRRHHLAGPPTGAGSLARPACQSDGTEGCSSSMLIGYMLHTTRIHATISLVPEPRPARPARPARY